MPIVREDFKTCKCGNKEFREEVTLRIGVDTLQRRDDSIQLSESAIYNRRHKYVCTKCGHVFPI